MVSKKSLSRTYLTLAQLLHQSKEAVVMFMPLKHVLLRSCCGGSLTRCNCRSRNCRVPNGNGRRRGQNRLGSCVLGRLRLLVIKRWSVTLFFLLHLGVFKLSYANALNTHKIILEDILKTTGKLGREPHKGHLPS